MLVDTNGAKYHVGDVISRIAEGVTLPEYESGYGQWRAAFDQGKGGIFTITVAEAVAFVESTLK